MKTKDRPTLIKELEDLIMAHRYLYYVMARPVILDQHYDLCERWARELVSEDSPLHLPGSDLESSYSPRQLQLAHQLFRKEETHEVLYGRYLRDLELPDE